MTVSGWCMLVRIVWKTSAVLVRYVAGEFFCSEMARCRIKCATNDTGSYNREQASLTPIIADVQM